MKRKRTQEKIRNHERMKERKETRKRENSSREIYKERKKKKKENAERFPTYIETNSLFSIQTINKRENNRNLCQTHSLNPDIFHMSIVGNLM